MAQKGIGVPDSDQTARHKHNLEDEGIESVPETAGGQTSHKTGKHSSVEKLAASRPEFGSSPGNTPVAGAFGAGDEDNSDVTTSENPRDKALRPK